MRSEDNCIWETVVGGSSVSFNLSSLQSYEVTLKWKVYLFGISAGNSTTYTFSFNNSQHQFHQNITASTIFNNCSVEKNVFVHKHTLTISAILLDFNTVTLNHSNNIGISEVLVVAKRCGGIQGTECL